MYIVSGAPSDRPSCWICASSNVVRHKGRGIDRALRPEDLRITDHRYGVTLALLRCRRCGFIFAEGDELGELVSLYEHLQDAEYERTQEPRRLQMRWLLDLGLRAHRSARTLLDVGAAAGAFVAEASGRGLDAVGIEPSLHLASAADRLHAVSLVQGTLPHEALAGRTFDLVYLADVLEHVTDPLALLGACRRMLAPGGVLVVVTPDAASLAATLLGGRWWHYRLSHVGYFSRANLTRALASAGLAPLRWVRAKWFFRAGYLAERLASYLPLAGVNRLAGRVGVLGRLYRRIVPLNLFDSWVVLARGPDVADNDSHG